MSCRTCNQSGAPSAAEVHRHSHPGLPDLCTPEGAAEFSDASRRDQMVQTVDLARQLLERAASNDRNASSVLAPLRPHARDPGAIIPDMRAPRSASLPFRGARLK
jgi:hypothetical protein